MIQVKFFARLRDDLGISELEVDSDGISTLYDVIEELKAKNDDWKVYFKKPLMMAVNQEMVQLDKAVVAGDEVAFFPPVTGG